MNKVMIFGVFDGINRTNDDFLRTAKKEGDYLIAVVAQDHTAFHLFNREPKFSFDDRFEKVLQGEIADEVVIGPANTSLLSLVKRHRPNIVVFGADQRLLKDDLTNELIREAHQPIIRELECNEFNSFS